MDDKLSIQELTNQSNQGKARLASNNSMKHKWNIDEMIRKAFHGLEYVVVIWSPHMQKDIKNLEIQRIAMKMVPEMKALTYEERLKEIERQKGERDLIMYEIVNCMEKIDRQKLVSLTEDGVRWVRGDPEESMFKEY